MKTIYLNRQGASGFTTVMDDVNEESVASAHQGEVITREAFMETKDMPAPMMDDPMALIDNHGKRLDV